MRKLGFAAIAPAVLLLISCDVQGSVETKTEPATETVVTIEDARIQLPAVPGRPGVAYFTVRTKHADELVGLTTPIARVELHQTRTENGVVRMERLQDTTIAAGQALEFKPGGKHAMLFNIDRAVQAGGEIPLTFTFRRAPPVDVQAHAQAAGDMGHMGH